MCGIAGYVGHSRDPRQDAAALHAMTEALHHRGPDGAGIWRDPEAGVGLGHRRLAVVELSEAGAQPMISPSGRYVLSFNGEIYNHTALRRLLETERGEYRWRGRSDTETVLAAVDAWGVETSVKRFDGMFAIALWDREARQLYLARDRLGEKPLYYGWFGSVFLFGSELKALQRHPHFCTDVDRGALCLYLRYGFVPAPYAIYRGTRKLPPASLLRVRANGGQFAPEAYWSLADASRHGQAPEDRLSDAAAIEALDQRLNAAVRRQLAADVAVGGLLSGGVDSSLIVALMQANSGRQVTTFTVRFDAKGYDESAHAARVAAHLGTNHHILPCLGSDALALVPTLPAMYDEPFADASQLPTAVVMRAARSQATVALSGDGGDEIFGGYTRYTWIPRVKRFAGPLPASVLRLLGALLARTPGPWIDALAAQARPGTASIRWAEKLHKLAPRLQAAGSVQELYRAVVASQWLHPERLVVDGMPPPTLLDDPAQWPALQDEVAQMMALDTLTYLPDDVLVKVDRASMAYALELRAPFLDRDVVEFAWSLPIDLKVRGATGKWILRRVLDRYVPRELVERPKMGFAVPLAEWLRGPLRPWAEALLAPERLRRERFLHPEPVAAAWRALRRGRDAAAPALWTVLMFQAWHATWNAAPAVDRASGDGQGLPSPATEVT